MNFKSPQLKIAQSCSTPTEASEQNLGNQYWVKRFKEIRQLSRTLITPLSEEDCVIQSMPDASPAKWHLAHTTWFFEAFILKTCLKNYKPFYPEFNYLFNSYYFGIGEPFNRLRRGLLSRPSLQKILRYRDQVDRAIEKIMAAQHLWSQPDLRRNIDLGLHHEQQHQELLLVDIKHLFSCNPLKPAYQSSRSEFSSKMTHVNWLTFPEGLYWIGHAQESFSYDNETPCHQLFLKPFQMACRLVTNGDYLEFIADRGYEKAELWLSDGWLSVKENEWRAPLYWEKKEKCWEQFTLHGMETLNLHEPVCHVSYYEADAYARWRGTRLPLETEWEVVAREQMVNGNLFESGALHPIPLQEKQSQKTAGQLYGDVWEWTLSPYSAYPGFKPLSGVKGEYNGKFMSNQMVLRGGSCLTQQSHIRSTYRNFFYPNARWQFSGIRLAKDL